MGPRKEPFSSIDVGGWAEHYASRPLGHYKAEVYRLCGASRHGLHEHPEPAPLLTEQANCPTVD